MSQIYVYATCGKFITSHSTLSDNIRSLELVSMKLDKQLSFRKLPSSVLTVLYYNNTLCALIVYGKCLATSICQTIPGTYLARSYFSSTLTNRMPFVRSKGKPSRTDFKTLSLEGFISMKSSEFVGTKGIVDVNVNLL